MKEGLPSLTAMAVAFARAAVTREPGAPGEGLDPFARDLLPGPARAALDLVAAAERISPLAGRVVRAASLGIVDHCELRSLAIDEVVRDALAAGAEQLVVVGAGLDARGRRLPEASRATVFEIDHPATQRYKRARWPADCVRFVPVDFERDALEGALAGAGHDARARTAWIWEGVTMYLVPEATRATLGTLADRSAPGSTLAVTYVLPELAELAEPVKPAVRALFGALGEPLRSLYSPAALAALLTGAGFDVASDTGPADWAARYHARRPRFLLAEHLAVGVRRP